MPQEASTASYWLSSLILTFHSSHTEFVLTAHSANHCLARYNRCLACSCNCQVYILWVELVCCAYFPNLCLTLSADLVHAAACLVQFKSSSCHIITNKTSCNTPLVVSLNLNANTSEYRANINVKQEHANWAV